MGNSGSWPGLGDGLVAFGDEWPLEVADIAVALELLRELSADKDKVDGYLNEFEPSVFYDRPVGKIMTVLVTSQ